MAACVFCNLDQTRYLMENDVAFVVNDINPVTEGHALIIPKRHFADLFDATEEENKGLFDLLRKRKEALQASDNTIDGFNVGVNIGQAAGQTVFHLHIHLIPRRKGDIDDPTGGVRGVIPGRRVY
ncbi:MAG: HIT family protein [Candidatus Delongbacteria bacterium]|nr:HIT family protein [Candidatus Delongbacteria bacterium]